MRNGIKPIQFKTITSSLHYTFQFDSNQFESIELCLCLYDAQNSVQNSKELSDLSLFTKADSSSLHD